MAAIDSTNSCKATYEHVIFSDLGFIFLSEITLSRLQTENLSGIRAGV